MHCILRGGMYRNAVYIVYFKLENKKLMDKSAYYVGTVCFKKPTSADTGTHFDFQL